MTFYDELVEGLDALDKMMMAIDLQISQAAKAEPEYQDVAKIMFRVYTAKSNMSMIYDEVAAILDKAMADVPEVNLEDGVKIEKKVASDRRAWKHADLATEIARRLIMTNVDMSTGETQKSTEELITEMLRFLQPSYWRVKELSTIGVNADNYCEVLEPKTSIIVRKPKVK